MAARPGARPRRRRLRPRRGCGSPDSTLPDGRRFRAPLADELDNHLRLLLEMNEGAPLDITEREEEKEEEFIEGPSVDQIGPDADD